MTTWVLDIQDRANTTVVADIPFKALTFNHTLNGFGSLEANFNFRDVDSTMANLSPGDHQAVLKADGVRVWGGLVVASRASLVQNSDHRLSILAEGFATSLQHRVVTSDLIYTNTKPHQIIWNLINHTQGKTDGDLGMTQGSHTNNVGTEDDVDRDYCAMEYPNVLESIQELIDTDDSCDWAIGPCFSFATMKQLRTWSTKRGTDLTGSVTLDQSKMSTLDYDIDATYLANYVYTQGTDDCNPPTEILTDATSLSNYGLWERVEDLQTTRKGDLRSHGREVIRNYKNPRWQASAKYWADNGPALGTFDVGDTITLASNVGFANFSRAMRVITIQVDISPPNVDFWTVTMDSVTS